MWLLAVGAVLLTQSWCFAEEGLYRPDNPLNPINSVDPKNPFNPINQFDPGNPQIRSNASIPTTPSIRSMNTIPKIR
jgi:hypothetical protein